MIKLVIKTYIFNIVMLLLFIVFMQWSALFRYCITKNCNLLFFSCPFHFRFSSTKDTAYISYIVMKNWRNIDFLSRLLSSYYRFDKYYQEIFHSFIVYMPNLKTFFFYIGVLFIVNHSQYLCKFEFLNIYFKS